MRPKITDIQRQTYDAIIIGGGINGAAAAQCIAAQGNSVLLVDKGDFCSGSSGRSSRLLHCGLRYLAPGRSIWDFVLHPSRFLTALKMARQGMIARSDFVRTSVARTRQMQFAFPVYKKGPYRGWQLDIAFLLLKLVGPSKPPLDYKRISADKVRNMPLARELRDIDQIHSVAIYREYQFDWAERIGMDSVLDAERMGAVVRNYTQATLLPCDANGIWNVKLTDEINGDSASVKAKVILNLAGIWIDDVNETANKSAKRCILGTKGTHIVVKLPDEYAGRGIATLNSKNEPFYCIPLNGYHFFGPSETVYEEDKDDIHVTAEEQAWLINEANRLMPGINIKLSDIKMTWAGVRPLTYDKAVPFGNRSRIVHDLAESGMPNVLAMTGGPVMSYRSAGKLLAKEVLKRVRPSFGKKEINFTPREIANASNSPAIVNGDASVGLEAVRQAVRFEHAVTLMDVLLRRTGVIWRHQLSDKEIRSAAVALAEERALTPAQMELEIERFTEEYQRLFAPRPSDAISV